MKEERGQDYENHFDSIPLLLKLPLFSVKHCGVHKPSQVSRMLIEQVTLCDSARVQQK